MMRRFGTLILTILAIVTPALSFGQAVSFEVGGPAHQIAHSVDILNCCTHFAIAGDNTPETSITVSGPPWAPPNSTQDAGSATATSATTIAHASNAGVAFTAVVSGSSTPSARDALNAHAGQGGTYYSFTLDRPMTVEMHGSVSFAHSSGGTFAAQFSLRAGAAGGAIVSGSSMDVNSGGNPGFTTGAVHMPPVTLPAGAYFLIAAISGVTGSRTTGAAENFSASISMNLRISDSQAVATVTCLTGTATIKPPGGTVQPLAVGSFVHMGDLIETGTQSRVCLNFIDNTDFTLGNNTKITIDNYVFDPNQDDAVSKTNVFGQIFRYVSGLIANKPDPDLQIDMPTGTIGIRGTEFIGKADSTQTVQEIYLNHGRIDVTPWHSGVATSFQAPIIVRFTIDGIVGSEPLSPEVYAALEQEVLGAETTPPTTTISFVPNAPDGTNSWYRQDVAVALSASDTESGVASSTYEIDGGATVTYAGSFQLTTDGVQTITYRSSDQAGNVESDKSAEVKIDKTKPTAIAFVGGIHDGNTFVFGSVPPNNTCTATDPTTGVASCVVTGYATSPGIHALTATATDNAGNSDSIRLSYTVNAPTTAAPQPFGYWKNNPAITGALLPQSLGTYLVDTAAKAMAVFNSPTSKNAFEMLAAQLLAAKLNQSRGVTAGCVSATIADAALLLTAAGYRGPGTTSPPAKNAKTAVTMDTNRLDAFNNLGCP
jgi:FecR-like protein